MIVIGTGFIPLIPLSIVLMMVMGEAASGKGYSKEHWLKEFQESMNRCTGRHDMTEIMLRYTPFS